MIEKAPMGVSREKEPAANIEALPETLRILKTNRTEYIIVVDDGQDFDALYTEWCALDDAFCEGKLPESKWVDIGTFLRKRNVSVLEPLAVQVLADFYGE